MGRIPQRFVIAMVGIALAVGMTGCAKKTAETSSSAPGGELKVVDVDLGRSVGGDKRVVQKVDTFAPNDMIYASVATSGVSPNATLKARWTFQDGQVVDESEQAIAPTGDAATEFHISKPDGWPTGKYKLEVLLNGTPVQTKDFEVK